MRTSQFLLVGCVGVFLASSGPALARESGFGHAGHFAGHGFHGGHRKAFGARRAQGFLFVGPVAPFGFYDDSSGVGPSFGPFGSGDLRDGLAGPAALPTGVGLLETGGGPQDEVGLAAEETDVTRARWSEPGPGECPPDQKLLRLPGKRSVRCADPRLVPLGASQVAP